VLLLLLCCSAAAIVASVACAASAARVANGRRVSGLSVLVVVSVTCGGSDFCFLDFGYGCFVF